MGQHFVSKIREHGILIDGRAIYVFVHIEDALVGFMYTYVPTTPRERVIFWDCILDVLPNVDHWVVGGDFNNIESHNDWRVAILPVLSSISSLEQQAWDRFILGLHVMDAWSMPSFGIRLYSLRFS